MNPGPQLLILAARIGSRYGGTKQLGNFGPSGESLIEYALYDAAQAGFSKVCLVIRPELEEAFLSRLSPYQDLIEITYAHQTLAQQLGGFTPPKDRIKPWGTGQAVLCAKDEITQPFAVINADDFYGAKAYQIMGDWLRKRTPTEARYALLGYPLKNTLSPHGTVSRGICAQEDDQLVSLEEHTQIRYEQEQIYDFSQDHPRPLSHNTPVSMNFWGFTPLIFQTLELGFNHFLQTRGAELKSEYYITSPIDNLVKTNQAQITLLPCEEHWMGVTYPEDKLALETGLLELHQRRQYPKTLKPLIIPG